MSHAKSQPIIDNISQPDPLTCVSLTIVDQITEVLTQRVLLGSLQQGEPLRQDALAFEFSVSQASVREAFRKLEMRHLVESLPRKGVRVTRINAVGEQEIATMRAALEPLALLSIKGNVAPKHLAAVRYALQAGDEAHDIFASEAANRAFHIALAVPCSMPRLIATIADLNFASSRHVFASERAATWRARSNLDHGRIYDAFVARDYRMAAQLVAAHIHAGDRTAQERSNNRENLKSSTGDKFVSA